jgi:4-amino-4-deoxychorismate lyase
MPATRAGRPIRTGMNIINGSAGEAISVRDRGFAYGDGVFRTFPLRRGKPVLWQRQYAKLAHDCRALKIDCPAAALLERDLSLLDTPDCIVKIIVTRGDSARGYAPPPAAAPARVIISSPLPQRPVGYSSQGVGVHLCRTRVAVQPALAGIKHLNRLENVLARAEWSDPDIAEGLLCDIDDNVIGGTMSNLFISRKGGLITPDLARCGVAGVMRDLVMELAHTHGIPLQVAAISLDDLFDAEEVFVVNSVIGLWPVVALGRRSWKTGALGAQLQHWIADAQVA